jgi:hypothetical protein
MGDGIRLALSAAFYLLALAATMSGLVSKGASLVLALIATALLVWAAYHYLREWHTAKKIDGRRGLDSWYFIAPCLLIVVLAAAGAAYGLGLRSSDAKPAMPQQATNSSPLIKGIHIDWVDDGTIWLTGIYTKTGTGLVASAAVFPVETFEIMGQSARKVMIAISSSLGSRIETDPVDRFGRETAAKIKIGTLIDNHGHWILQLGQSKLEIERWGYFGVIYLGDKENEPIPFAIISRKTDQNNPSPIFIGPDVLGMLSNAEK